MTVIYGIKNCDTVKKARQWLEKRDIEYRFIDYRADGIDKAQVIQWRDSLGITSLINKRSTSWKTLSEEQKTLLSDESANGPIEAQVELIISLPTLIKRPLLEKQSAVHVGFSDTTYSNIFTD